MTAPSSSEATHRHVWFAAIGLWFCACPVVAAEEHVDLDMVTRIRQEGFHSSKVMETMGELTDRLGPRLTGSPQLKRANEWTRDQLTSWGLKNAHLEQWGPFGRGWAWELCTVRMLSPAVAQLVAVPGAWSPPTQGVVRGKVMKVKLTTEEDLTKQHGKLSGVIVLREPVPETPRPGDNRPPSDGRPPSENPPPSADRRDASLVRYDDKRLEDISHYAIPSERPPFDRAERRKRQAFQKRLNKFLMDEKVLALIERGRGEDGTVFTPSARRPRTKDDLLGVPTVIMAAENYGRLTRLLERKLDLQVDLEVRAKYHDDDPMAYNTIAEIPGTDKKNEVVMLGAHLDSWHAGTGATDNAAGSAVVMEAARILQSLGVKPRRTIRVALWSGEEQGLLGSRAYVTEHFGARAIPPDPNDDTSRPRGPFKLKKEHAQVSAYFNLDNGSGKIRGVFLQENAAVQPIFAAWIEPFRDLGATTLTMRSTRGTDHLSFDDVGIPGFQFIQDPLDYRSRTHHSNMDVYERIKRDDLMQASVVMASFAYHAAMRDRMLPRKPLPKEEPEPKEEQRPLVAGQNQSPAEPVAGTGHQ